MIGSAQAQSTQPPASRPAPTTDFTIPPPAAPPRTEAPAPGAPASGAPGTAAPASPFSSLSRGPSTAETVLGLGLLLVLAVVFLYVRGSVRAHLVGRRAALDAANGAAWMLFSALMLTAVVLVTAALGDLWRHWLGLAAGLGVCAVLFTVAAVLFVRAPQRRR